MATEFGRGGTAVGIARARDIANGTRLSPSTMRRMKAFFDRHEVDKMAKDSVRAKKLPLERTIAWALWGGDPGYAWARKVVGQMNAADKKAKTMKDKTVKTTMGKRMSTQDATMKTQNAHDEADHDAATERATRRQVRAFRRNVPTRSTTRRMLATRWRGSSKTRAVCPKSNTMKPSRNILKVQAFWHQARRQDADETSKGLTFRTNAKMTSIHVHHMRMSDKPGETCRRCD